MQSLAFFPAKGDICPACPALISYLLSGIDYHYLNYTGKHGENMMIAISACLAGEAVRYDGSHKLYAPLKALQSSGMAVPVCPEILGGLPVPRAPAEITGGEGCDVWVGTARVTGSDGEDVTDAFKQGALQALEHLQQRNITHVILKANSPSCGSGLIYSGAFDGTLKSGNGVATALFEANGITVWHEDHPELPALIEQLLQNGKSA